MSEVHHSNCDVFMLVLVPTISTYFSAADVDSEPHLSTMRFIIHDANSMSKCDGDNTGVAPALWLSLRLLLVLTSTTKLKTENSYYLPSRKNLDCTHAFPSCSFLVTSISVSYYIAKITIFTYVFMPGSSI